MKNFQNHKSLTVELGKGTNAIAGGNQRGKSAIVRSIKWAYENSPNGNWMRRKDKKGKVYTASVKIDKYDGTTIIRKRGKHNNCYIVGDEKYQSVGKDMPQEVIRALNIERSYYRDLRISPYLHMQGKPPFLVDATSTDRAKAINMLTGANLAEKAIGEYNKEKHGVARDIKYNDSQIEQLREKLKTYAVLKTLPLFELNEAKERSESIQVKITTVYDIIDELTEQRHILYSYEDISKVYSQITKAEEMHPDLESAEELLESVSEISGEITKWKSYRKPDGIDKISIAERNLESLGEAEDMVRFLEDASGLLDEQAILMHRAKVEMDKASAGMKKCKVLCPKCKTPVPMENYI